MRDRVEPRGFGGSERGLPVAAVANTMISSMAGGADDNPGEEVASDDAPLSPDQPSATNLEDIPDPQEGVLGSDPEPNPS